MVGSLRSLYGRLGPRYPRRLLLATLPLAGVIGLAATLGTALYVDMSRGEFALLAIASWVFIWMPDAFFEARAIRRLIGPVERWLMGSRDPHGSLTAWDAAASLPLAVFRQPWLYLVLAAGMLAWGTYAVSVLDLPDWSVGVFFAASALVYLYHLVLRFLAMELILRPVLEDIAAALPPEANVRPTRVPLRNRLFATLPAVNLISGVAVGGFTAHDGDDLGALGLALLGSAAVGVLVSSWLIGFLSNSITTPITQLRDATRRVGCGDLSVRVPVASTDETGELAHSFNEMVAGLEQRERLREAFGTFVDPDLAERVLEEGTDLAGEEVEVSLLFIDIRGFTSYAERAPAEAVVARLNDLYGEVVPVILRHGGHANKFIGDGLLAVFGAPRRLPNHADCAVRAGTEMAQLVRDRYGGELRIGVGINSGRVVVGTIGGGGRLDFTVIGDPVNTASRVEAATRDTGDDLLITAATHERLAEETGHWVERGTVPLKGKSAEVQLYACERLDGPST